jgi:CBS domain containing-hemolysin-like protein
MSGALAEAMLVLLCIVVQAFFAGSEMAVVSADRLALQARADEGHRGAIRALRLLERPTRFVGVCLLGANLATITGASLLTHLLHTLGHDNELLAVAIYTPLTVVLAEVVPKSVFLQHADALAPVLAAPLALVMKLGAPVLWFGEKLEHGILAMLGKRAHDPNAMNREDIRLLLDSEAAGDIQAEEKEMIRRVFSFSETRVEDAMVPLIEVQAVPADATVDEASAIMVEQGWSRMPVYRERIDDIVGVVSHHDLLFAADGAAQVLTVAHDVTFVPETTRVEDVFRRLTAKRQRLAVVVDEYGGAVGILSIEDIVEEIVGEIDDEFDGRRPLVRRTSEREWVASGRAEAEQLLDATGFRMPEGAYETVAGFLLAQMGHVPAVGEKLAWDGWVFTVTSANERAILEVTLQPASDEARAAAPRAR